MPSKLAGFRPNGGKIKFTNTSDGFKIRYGIWNTGTKGTIFFLNGRTEYIEKYSETISKFLCRNYSVVSLDWRSQGLPGDHPVRRPRHPVPGLCRQTLQETPMFDSAGL